MSGIYKFDTPLDAKLPKMLYAIIYIANYACSI